MSDDVHDDLDGAVDDLLDALDSDAPEAGSTATAEPAPARRVFWWAQGETADLKVAWYRLENFVEWLFAVYAPTAQEIPDCWVEHADVVQELWAVMLAHEAWHASDEDPLGPIQFAGHWAQARTRLQQRPDGAVCAAGGHRPGLRTDDQAARRASYPIPRPYGWTWPNETSSKEHP